MTVDYGHHEPPWSVVANDRQEAADARRHEPAWREQRRVGDRWAEQPDVPDEWDEPA